MAEKQCWTVATGKVKLTNKRSRLAAKYITGLHGFVGVHIVPDGRCLWLFDSENNAKIARNMMNAKGIKSGYNICECFVDEKYLKKEIEDEQ